MVSTTVERCLAGAPLQEAQLQLTQLDLVILLEKDPNTSCIGEGCAAQVTCIYSGKGKS